MILHITLRFVLLHLTQTWYYVWTFQGSVIDALFEFALLYDDGTVGGEQQLAGPSLVAFPVILGDWHCILISE